MATVSLGGSIVLDITAKQKPDDPADDGHGEAGEDGWVRHWRILQEPRSLLVTTGSAYSETLHGISNVTEDKDLNARTVSNWKLLGDQDTLVANGGCNKRTTRISLTLRDAKKVSTVQSKIFGKQKT